MTPDEIRPEEVPDLTPLEIRDTIQRIQTDLSRRATDARKPWWESRTIWGAVIVLVAQVALQFGVAIDVSAMTETALSLATLIGAGMAWWGRMTAERPVSRTRILPGVELAASP